VTVVIVTHRRSILSAADRVLEIRAGLLRPAEPQA